MMTLIWMIFRMKFNDIINDDINLDDISDEI